MGFFSKKAHGVLLIDITTSSVGGAYMVHRKDQQPVLCYTVRLPLEPLDKEELVDTLVRTLETLAQTLITQGSPQLHKEAGTGHIEMIVVSVSAPWQETKVRMVSIVEEFSFAFTRSLMERAARSAKTPIGKTVSDTAVISTALNGYKMDRPWGKHAERADMTVLTSLIDTSVQTRIRTTLRAAFHSHPITFAAAAPVAYAVINSLYPLQHDFLVVNIDGNSSGATLVKDRVIAGVATIPLGTHDLLCAGQAAAKTSGDLLDSRQENEEFGKRVERAEQEWILELRGLLATLASEHPLPRAVFLLASADTRDYLKNLIDQSSLHTLWLSGEPLSVIALSPEHTATKIRTRGLAEADVPLALLALFFEETLARD